MKYIDYILDRVTMYRLLLYYLIFLLVVAVVLGSVGVLIYSPFAIVGSSFILLGVCLAVNKLFAVVFEAPTNVESPYLTALILACILPPLQSTHNLPLLGWAATLAMASKYILAVHKKHLFNPAAIAVVITALSFGGSATWWIGTLPMLPAVVVGGLLIMRKTRREDLVFYCGLAAVLTVGLFTIAKGGDPLQNVQRLLLQSPLFFFAFVMLTEPLTMPPTVSLQITYGVLVGILFTPQLHLGSLYSTPEVALVVGNLYSYLVSPKEKLLLTLTEIVQLTPDIWDFVFSLSRPLRFQPGQYMEWTLDYPNPDSRGNRRYFTLASSPTENTLRIGVRLSNPGSRFKTALGGLTSQTTVVASQLAGEFTLPTNPTQPLVLIAGGIGITPYRSMIKYLLDTNQPRPITLLYSSRRPGDFVYTDIFEEARTKLGIKTVYIANEGTDSTWAGRTGMLDAAAIQAEVPDIPHSLFYISGPHGMVTAMSETLRAIGVHKDHIKTDFFPGLT